MAAAKRFVHGQFVMIPNTTHGVYRTSPCARRLVRAFLADPTAKLDTACVGTDPGGFTFKTR